MLPQFSWKVAGKLSRSVTVQADEFYRVVNGAFADSNYIGGINKSVGYTADGDGIALFYSRMAF